MMSSRSFIVLFCLTLLFGTALFIAPVARAKDEKLKPEQLIAKHLESIGSPEALKAIKTRATAGASHITIRVGGQADMEGAGNLMSDGFALRLSLKFPALNYPGEQLAFDGSKTFVGQIAPGARSNLGSFIFTNDELLTEGLMFGTLSTSWALLNQSDRQPKLDLSGQKKSEGRSLYELRYTPKRRNGNVTAFFYFDAETFRHVRSQFKAEIVPIQSSSGGSGRGGGGGKGGGGGGPSGTTERGETTKYTITEQFDDFKQVDGLTLPHAYKLDFAVDAPNGGFVGTWTYTVKQVAHNQPIEKQIFSLN
jgi:hypothetical protein